MNLFNEKITNSFVSRSYLLENLRSHEYDVLIIGGGATGAGSALDAASRGLKVALIEANDYGAATSSRSTKLVHGGVRYLEDAVKHLDFGQYELVRDALRERQRFLDNAPYLTSSLPIYTPIYSWFDAAYYWAGLKAYDLIAKGSALGKSQFISRNEAIKRFSMIKKEGLKGAVVYYDGQFNDARMNLALILSAIREGATALNYVKAVELVKNDNKLSGAIVRDEETGATFEVRAKTVINATGVYTDSIRKMDDINVANIMVPSQGSHIVLSEKFSSPDGGLLIPKTSDGRVIFLLPWQGKTIAGTTDHAHEITLTPKAASEEVDYILEHLRKYFAVPVKKEDVLATWSGLRPLASLQNEHDNTANISRDHLINISKSSLITIVGGKWTTYRKMAEDVVDKAIAIGSLQPNKPCITKDLRLVGAHYFNHDIVKELVAYENFEPDIALHLAHSYGDMVYMVIDVEQKSRRHRLLKEYPYLEAEVIFSVTREYALHGVDILARRMRLAFLDNEAAKKALVKIVDIMGEILKWDDDKKHLEIKHGLDFLSTMI